MRSARIVVLALLLLGGFHLYRNVLPYNSAPQNPLTPEILSQHDYDRTNEKGTYLGKDVYSYEIPKPQTIAMVLGNSDATNKRVEVDLSAQRVYAYEGDKKVYEFVVSTGLWGRTPTGNFTIEYKTRAQKMSGGNVALNTYYYLPNVPFVQFFGNSQIPWSRGFSFHGTYWHSNFGHPMSHGCINMKTEDAETLYNWTTPILGDKSSQKTSTDNPGTPVIIYGTTPTS